MDPLGSCVAWLCSAPLGPALQGRLWTNSDQPNNTGTGFGPFGKGVPEFHSHDGNFETLPDRLQLATGGEEEPGNGRLGALGIAISGKVTPASWHDCPRTVCLLLHRKGSRHSGQELTQQPFTGRLVAEVGLEADVPGLSGSSCGAVATALSKLLLRQAGRLPLADVTSVVLANAATNACPAPTFVERELLAEMLDPAVQVHCAWLSDPPGPNGKLRLWSTTVGDLYPFSSTFLSRHNGDICSCGRAAAETKSYADSDESRLFDAVRKATKTNQVALQSNERTTSADSSKGTTSAAGVLFTSGEVQVCTATLAAEDALVASCSTTFRQPHRQHRAGVLTSSVDAILRLSTLMEEHCKQGDEPILLLLCDGSGQVHAPSGRVPVPATLEKGFQRHLEIKMYKK
eukprot:TRINITY_DN15917_c0_g1_i1.p1 TRINITY_DN15917_c0_g1~~TRINITY_DN15917_c0_g1_i1.p1  ORF type:complete len:402 (-),score=63.94 TRINITY_DN15917_c0_g1_i1:164-1369(-)